MATTWGAFSGHLRVGIDVTTGTITSATTVTTVSVHFYVQVDSTWNFADNQAMEVSGSISAHYDYYNGLGANASLKVGQYNFNANLSYSGGPTYTFKGTVSGHYQGASPTHTRTWSLPARPASVPGAPSVTISQVDADSAYIDIGAPANNGSTIVEYSVQVDNSSAFTSVDRTLAGDGTVSGLAAATTYYVRARARNGIGWGAYSATKSFTTGATTPGVPTSFDLGTMGETTAPLTWAAPSSNGGSAIDDYTVQVATNSSFTSGVQTVTVEGTSYTFTGLTPGTKYWFRVRANNGVGAGSYTAAQTDSTLTGTPTIYSPADGGTKSNAIFDVTVTAGGITAGRTITVEMSRSSTFASGVLTHSISPSGASSNNRYQVKNSNIYIDTGLWYVRAKVTNTSTGYVTPWSPTISYNESHVPSASVQTPTGGQTQSWSASTPLTFLFTDPAAPNDWMTAYQIQVQNNATSEVVLDTGKTVYTAEPDETSITRSVAIAEAYKAVGLRWRVRVWDRSDDASAYTGWALFTLADPPVVNIQTPSDILAVDTGSPTFSWDPSFPSGGSQVSAIVEVFEQDSMTKVWEGGVAGNATSITPDVVILRNQINYFVNITLTDSTGLVGTATRSFSTDYQAPESIPYYIIADAADDAGYIEVNWDDANPDELFAEWKVYRRNPGEQWELLARVANQNTRQYRDYNLTAGATYQYSVTQVATRSGSLLESPVGYYMVADQEVTENRSYIVELNYYWIINPDDPTQSIRLLNVTEDSSTLAFEDATYNIIGRGRHRDYGDELGYSGTLTCQVRINERPSSFRMRIEALRRSKETYQLRTPFGQIFNIALGDIGWTPLSGVGTAEMGDMTIPYEEVR